MESPMGASTVTFEPSGLIKFTLIVFFAAQENKNKYVSASSIVHKQNIRY
jgi:hypothetical protein